MQRRESVFAGVANFFREGNKDYWEGQRFLAQNRLLMGKSRDAVADAILFSRASRKLEQIRANEIKRGARQLSKATRARRNSAIKAIARTEGMQRRIKLTPPKK